MNGLFTRITPVFIDVRVAQCLALCVMFCRSLVDLFVLFILSFVLSVRLPFSDSDDFLRIFKLFFSNLYHEYF